MYVKLSKDVNTGKGFILHDDWKFLSFAGYGGLIWKVDGKLVDVKAWADRVGGTIIADVVALPELDALKLIGIKAEIIRMEAELVDLKAIKTTLEAVK